MERVGFVCSLLTRSGIPNIVALISPYRETRNQLRNTIKNFVEIYVQCSLEVCEIRDTKGLYKKARLGIFNNFTGINHPYEPPLNPDVVCRTENESFQESLKKILKALENLGYISIQKPSAPDLIVLL